MEESTSKINFASIWRLDFDAIISQSEKKVPTASSILRSLFKLERKPQEPHSHEHGHSGDSSTCWHFKRQPLFKEEDDKMIVIR